MLSSTSHVHSVDIINVMAIGSVWCSGQTILLFSQGEECGGNGS